jgi:hypothetical protein
VGCLLFAGEVIGHLAPRRGRAHALAVADAAAAEAAGGRGRSVRKPVAGVGAGSRGTALGAALRAAALVLKRRSLVLVLSDFRAESWSGALGRLARRHDVVSVRISDRSDFELPRRGSFETVDPETGVRAWLPLASRRWREQWREAGEARRADDLAACAEARSPVLEIDTADDPARAILEFFERRRGA